MIEVVFNADLSELEDSKVLRVEACINEYIGKNLDIAYENNLSALFSNIYKFEENKSTKDKVKEILLKHSEFIIGDLEKSSSKKILTYKRTFYSIYAYLMYFYPSSFEYNPERKSISISEDYKTLVDIPIISSENLEENELFINKSIQICNPFYYNGKAPVLLYNTMNSTAGTTLKEFVLDNSGISEAECKLFFNFSTPYHRVHSDGAISKQDNNYIHSWQLDSLDSKVVLYRSYANYTAWYIIAIGAGLLVLTIGLIVALIINNHKKKIGIITLKKIDEFVSSNDINKK